MKMYLAKLVFAVQTDGNTFSSEFDEQFRIIESPDREGAFYKARRIGGLEEETFINSGKQQTTWKFIDVTDIHSLSDSRDGEQIYSTSKRTEDGDSYINYVRQKSMEMQVKNLTFA